MSGWNKEKTKHGDPSRLFPRLQEKQSKMERGYTLSIKGKSMRLDKKLEKYATYRKYNLKYKNTESSISKIH